MSELEIEGTFDEQWGIVKASVRQHHAAINGNGKEGLLDFMAGLKAQQRLIITLLVFLSTLAVVVTALVAIKSANSGKLEIPGLSHSLPTDPVLSLSHQQADLPQTYVAR